MTFAAKSLGTGQHHQRTEVEVSPGFSMGSHAKVMTNMQSNPSRGVRFKIGDW